MMTAPASAAALCVALTACASRAPAGHLVSQGPPVSISSPALSVGISMRYMTAHSVNLVVHLVARRRLGMVRVRVRSVDHRVAITPGCTLHTLQPPHGMMAPKPPYPLPAVPLCSLVLRASQAGAYPIEVRIVDGEEHALVAPVRAIIDIPGKRP